MAFYKVFNDAGIIGVGTSDDLRKHQKKHNILVFAGGSDAQFITVADGYYHDKWMKEPTSEMVEWENATVVGIAEEEYLALKTALENDLTITAEEEEIADAEDDYEELPEYDDLELSVDYIRSVKLRELNLACRRAITEGFDLEIDGIDMHFSMTANDQLNLQDAAIRISTGATSVLYHPDEGEFMVMEAENMLKIIDAANEHKTYHMAYFNALKKWVNALKRASSIQAVEYGSDIPAKYLTTFLKSILEG